MNSIAVADTLSESPRGAASEIRRLRVIIGVLVVAIAALCAMVTLLTQQNRELKARAILASAGAVPDSLSVGRTVGPLALTDREGVRTTLAFGPGTPSSLVLVMSDGCPHCESMAPVYEDLLAKAGNPGVRTVAVVLDAKDPAALRTLGVGLPTYAAAGQARTWLRDVPIVPSAFLLDGQGRITREWIGEITDDKAKEDFMFALIGAGVK